MNIFNPYFDLNKYLLKIQEEGIKKDGFELESTILYISKIFFGNITSIENILHQIYIDVFKKQSMKLKLINMSQNSEVEFIKLLQKLLNRNYYAYISNTSSTNVSQLRMYNNINVAKPTFFSIHKLKISDYETINKFILRANLSSTKTNSTSNSNNEVRWSNSNHSSNSNSNGSNIEYTKEDLERIIDLIKKKMTNNSELNKHIRNTTPNIYNSDPLIEKLKNIYQFEVFILLIYKKYYSNIFSFMTKVTVLRNTEIEAAARQQAEREAVAKQQAEREAVAKQQAEREAVAKQQAETAIKQRVEAATKQRVEEETHRRTQEKASKILKNSTQKSANPINLNILTKI
jgi:hypothetical protein